MCAYVCVRMYVCCMCTYVVCVRMLYMCTYVCVRVYMYVCMCTYVVCVRMLYVCVYMYVRCWEGTKTSFSFVSVHKSEICLCHFFSEVTT